MATYIELRARAKEYGINPVGIKKEDLAQLIEDYEAKHKEKKTKGELPEMKPEPKEEIEEKIEIPVVEEIKVKKEEAKPAIRKELVAFARKAEEVLGLGTPFNCEEGEEELISELRFELDPETHPVGQGTDPEHFGIDLTKEELAENVIFDQEDIAIFKSLKITIPAQPKKAKKEKKQSVGANKHDVARELNEKKATMEEWTEAFVGIYEKEKEKLVADKKIEDTEEAFKKWCRKRAKAYKSWAMRNK